MAVQLWPHRRQTTDDTMPGDGGSAGDAPAGTRARTDTAPDRTTARETERRPLAWPRSRRADADTVVIDRRRWQRMRRHRHNPVSRLIWAAGWTAAIILAVGMLLTWVDANQANALVRKTLGMGTWLATPFQDLFRNSDPEKRLYLNWGTAAGVYYVLGRVASWLVRW